jgi:hypothetical protein
VGLAGGSLGARRCQASQVQGSHHDVRAVGWVQTNERKRRMRVIRTHRSREVHAHRRAALQGRGRAHSLASLDAHAHTDGHNGGKPHSHPHEPDVTSLTLDAAGVESAGRASRLPCDGVKCALEQVVVLPHECAVTRSESHAKGPHATRAACTHQESELLNDIFNLDSPEIFS